MWIMYALLSAIAAASRRTSEKQLTTNLNHFTIAFSTQLFSLPIIGLALALSGQILNPLQLGAQFWLPLIIVVVGFYPLNAFLYLQSIKHDELSSVLPIQSLGPIFGLLLGFIALQEIPTPLAIVAVLTTVLGVYVLGLQGRSLHHPLKPFYESRASRYMLAAVALSTSVSVLDKIAVQASNPLFYSFVSTLGATIMLYVTMRVRGVNDISIALQRRKELGLIGSLQGISYTTFLLAISSGPIGYVSAIRSSNVVLGSLLGIAVLKEKVTWQKITSLILISLGIALLALS